MTNPKLALIPSGYKGGTNPTVYSILPNDATGDFDFDRASEGTRIRKDGLIEEVTNDVPRLDWLNSNCPSLLLEPQRTNLQAYSENFSGLAWTPALVTITANSNISPNGELTAYKIESDQTNFTAELRGFLQINANTEYTYSLYVKAGTTSVCRIDLTDTLSGGASYYYGRVTFDMATETLTTDLATASFDKLDGGWYRLKITATSPNPLQGATRSSIILPEVGSIFIWGAQMEAGGYATSYIKNVDDANGVTRLKDEVFAEDSNLFNITEGTLFVDATPFKSGGGMEIQLSDGTANNRHTIQYQGTGTSVRALTVRGGTIVFSDYNPLTFDQRNKLAITFKKDEFKFYVNGSLVHTDTSGDVPTGLDKLTFSNPNLTGTFMEGKIHDIRVYDKVLTQTEAIQLTTI